MKRKNKMLARLVAACAFLLALTSPCRASDIQNPSPATAATTPGGAANSIQFNNGGAFGGFGSWNGTTFTVPGAANSLNFAGSSTGNPVTITTSGSDTYVPIHMLPKGYDVDYQHFAGLLISPNSTVPTVVQQTLDSASILLENENGNAGNFILRAANESYGNYVMASSRGTLAVPTSSMADDWSGIITWKSFDGTGFFGVAEIEVINDLDPGVTGMYGRMHIRVADGSGSLGSVPGIHLYSDGKIGLRTIVPQQDVDITGVTRISSLTASLPVATNASKDLVSTSVLNITKISGLTSNGFVKTSGSDGTLSVQTGGVTASGATCTITAITGGIITAGSCL